MSAAYENYFPGENYARKKTGGEAEAFNHIEILNMGYDLFMTLSVPARSAQINQNVKSAKLAYHPDKAKMMPDETEEEFDQRKNLNSRKLQLMTISADIFTHPNKVNAFLEKYMEYLHAVKEEKKKSQFIITHKEKRTKGFLLSLLVSE